MTKFFDSMMFTHLYHRVADEITPLSDAVKVFDVNDGIDVDHHISGVLLKYRLRLQWNCDIALPENADDSAIQEVKYMAQKYLKRHMYGEIKDKIFGIYVAIKSGDKIRSLDLLTELDEMCS